MEPIMFKACLTAIVRSVTRSGLFPLALVVLAIVFAFSAVVPSQTGSFIYEAPFIKENRLNILEESLASGAYDTAPQSIQDANARNLKLLRITQKGDIAASLRAQAELAKSDLEEYESGTLVGDKLMLESKLSFLTRLSAMGDPLLFASTVDEPMLYHLAGIFGSMPPLLFVAVVVATTHCVLGNLKTGKLAAQFPISPLQKQAIGFIAAVFLSVFVLFVAMLPVAVISLVRNGVGDPSYPVVMIQGGEVIEFTVASALFRSLCMYVLVALFIAALCSLLFALTATAAPGCLFALALGFVPSIPQYFSETFLLRSVLAYLPTTYLYFAAVSGYPSYINVSDMLPVPGAGFELGLAVLAGSAALLLAGVVAVCAFRSSLRQRRGCMAHAHLS